MAAQSGVNRPDLDPFPAELLTFLAVEAEVVEGYRDPHHWHGGNGDQPDATLSAVAHRMGHKDHQECRWEGADH